MRRSATTSLERWTGARPPILRKVYRYPGFRGPLRGILRNTCLAPSRVAREFRALKHLAALGLQPDLALGFREERRLGFLRRAELWMLDFGGKDLESLGASPPRETGFWEGLRTFLLGLRGSGLVDPDLWARNLLYRAEDHRFAKIDASASVLLPPARARRSALRNELILLAELRRLGFPVDHLEALGQALGHPGGIGTTGINPSGR